MGELTIRSAQAERNLLEWSQRVAECRSSGQSVTRWCAEHDIKPKTYFHWQKKVFTAMIEQQRQQLEEPQKKSRQERKLLSVFIELWDGIKRSGSCRCGCGSRSA